MATAAKLKLLSGERVVISSDTNTLVLTNLRIRLDSRVTGSSNLVTMALDAVASCGLVTRSYPTLLGIAGALGLVGVVIERGNAQVAAFVVAAAFVFAYLRTRSALLTITSSGGSQIVVPAAGLSRDNVIEFIDAIEHERLESQRRAY